MIVSLLTVPARVLALGTLLLAFTGVLGAVETLVHANQQVELLVPILGIPASMAPREEPVYAPNFILVLRDEVAA